MARIVRNIECRVPFLEGVHVSSAAGALSFPENFGLVRNRNVGDDGTDHVTGA